MGQYADVYLNAMRTLRPKEAASRSADLPREARAAERRAQNQHDTVLAALQKAHPEPSDYASRVQHYQNLDQMARESAIAEMLEGIQPESPTNGDASPKNRPKARNTLG